MTGASGPAFKYTRDRKATKPRAAAYHGASANEQKSERNGSMIPQKTFRALCAVGALMAVGALAWPGTATAQDEEKPYEIKDGVVDWYTFSGFRRYHAECHVFTSLCRASVWAIFGDKSARSRLVMNVWRFE